MKNQLHQEVLLSFLAVLVGCTPGPEEVATVHSTADRESRVDAIINGTIVARGSLSPLGIVSVNSSIGSCTGTLLTNRHVLTARHCVRSIPGGVAASSITVRLEGATVSADQTLAASASEPSLPLGSGENDYAVLTTGVPFVVSGSPERHIRRIWRGTNAQLNGVTAFCAGGGFNVGATTTSLASGSGLRTANLTLEWAVTDFGQIRILRNGAGQISSFGDSGSSCSFQNRITSVLSTGECPIDSVDQNGNGMIDSRECLPGPVARASAPSSFRAFAEGITQTSVSVSVSLVQSRISVPSLDVRITSADGEASELTLLGTGVLTRGSAPIAHRATEIEVTALNPQSDVLCPRSRLRVPMTGFAEVIMTCLNRGALAAVL